MSDRNMSQLGLIMDTFGVTGRELGDLLHVDYSLVSKWRTGKRKITAQYLEKIVEYFLTLDSRSNYKRISDILKKYYPHVTLDSLVVMRELLSKWLMDSRKFAANEHSYYQLDSDTYSVQFEVYKNNTGRRKAIIRFLDFVMSLPPGQEILLLTQEEVTWLIEDKNFLTFWRNSLKEIIKKGHHITIIHTVDRQLDFLFPFLTEWIPLHITGKTTSRYFPKYVDKMFDRTMFIIKDQAVLASMKANNFSKVSYTFLYTDPFTVQEFQARFEALYSSSADLFKFYTIEEVEDLEKIILEAEQIPGNCYIYSALPALEIMSQPLLYEILVANNFEQKEIRNYMSYHRFLRKMLAGQAEKCFYRQIIDILQLERAIKHNNITLYNPGKPINIPVKLFIQYLEELIQLIDQYPQYEIALVTEQPIPSLEKISVKIKQNAFVAASTVYGYNGYNVNKNSLYSNEMTIINAFYEYMDNIWNEIPRIQRDKKWVGENLANLIFRIQNEDKRDMLVKYG